MLLNLKYIWICTYSTVWRWQYICPSVYPFTFFGTHITQGFPHQPKWHLLKWNSIFQDHRVYFYNPTPATSYPSTQVFNNKVQLKQLLLRWWFKSHSVYFYFLIASSMLISCIHMYVHIYCDRATAYIMVNHVYSKPGLNL